MNENGNSSLETLLERAEEYGKTTLEILKLKAVDKTSETAANVASGAMAAFLALMFVLTGTFALGFWLGDLLGKAWYGFLIVAGFYALLGVLLLFVFNKSLKTLIANVIIKKLLK